MLGKNKIKEAIKEGSIKISNFDEANLNSISYDMEIDDEIKCYNNYRCLDSKKENMNYDIINLSEEEDKSIILKPGNLYLATTKESVWSNKYIPCITGRSTYARLGIQIHQTAFFANLGHEFKWVLEISAVVPVILHKGTKLSQMYFEEISGDITSDMIYHGKYEKENDKPGIPD